ncbi:MAG: stage III sporulation protein AB [Oscillospiraceae bacterium]|jgi:stage III sporulation protein AB|nr:stage III sporulation protein AB [Oscillospiraceae bacterium]
MLKAIGIILVLTGTGGFGVAKAMQFYRTVRHLRELRNAVEILKCEINYALLPLPELCKAAAKRISGAPAQFFRRFAALVEQGIDRDTAAAQALEQAHGLSLPSDAKMALLELCSSLGCYDLDGENRVLQLTGHRIHSALERCEAEKKMQAKSYAALGICTGIAIVILMI